VQALAGAFQKLHALYGSNPDPLAYTNQNVYALPKNTPLFRELDLILEAHIIPEAIDFYNDPRVGLSMRCPRVIMRVCHAWHAQWDIGFLFGSQA
jgi:hypothetical protein